MSKRSTAKKLAVNMLSRGRINMKDPHEVQSVHELIDYILDAAKTEILRETVGIPEIMERTVELDGLFFSAGMRVRNKKIDYEYDIVLNKGVLCFRKAFCRKLIPVKEYPSVCVSYEPGDLEIVSYEPGDLEIIENEQDPVNRDQAEVLDDKETGLYDKYKVERVDGKPLKGGCIVLEWGDPLARPGIRAFADAVGAAGYHDLARDLYNTLEAWDGRIPFYKVEPGTEFIWDEKRYLKIEYIPMGNAVDMSTGRCFKVPNMAPVIIVEKEINPKETRNA